MTELHCMLKDLLKLYCIWTWNTLWCFSFFCLVGFCLFFSPLMRQQNYFWDTIPRIGGWGTNTKIIKTETLLHLNLEIFFKFSLCLSNTCLAYCWLVHYLSLFISLALFFFCCCCLFVFWFFLLLCLFFPFFFTFFAFPLLSPFHSR
jgi:hypothetical protein